MPFTADDLGGYAGALLDELTADVGLQRLTQWKMLERPDATEAEIEAHRSRAEAIAHHHGASLDRGMDALMVAIAAAQA